MSSIRQKPAGALRLDDIIDFLSSEEGAPHVAALKKDLEAGGVPFKGPVLGPHLTDAPDDAFLGLVAHGLYGSFLRKSQMIAAIPPMVGYAYAHAADKEGRVDFENVERVLGPKAAVLFAELQAKLDGGKKFVPTSRRLTKYRFLPRDVIQLVAKSAPLMDIGERMPVLGMVTRMLGGKDKLAGLKMLAVQHLFPTTVPLFDELVKNGLDPKGATVFGKNYSTNPDVLYRMAAAGWDMPTLSTTRLVTTLPDGTEKEVSPIAGSLERLFEGVDPKKEKGPKFLLLDEGGKLVTALHEHFPEYAHLCVAVEQTDRGIQLIEAMQARGIQLKCPVINVARSWAKKDYEAPMIGESVAHSIDLAIADIHPDLEVKPKHAAIIGYGAVGKATADALRRRGYTVWVYDTDPAKMKQAFDEGCSIGTREEVLKHGHLLVSCTGRTTITPDEYDLLPNRAILVNAASGNHELGMDRLPQSGNFLTGDPKETFDERGFRRTTFNGLDLNLGDLAGGDEMFSRVIRGKNGDERLVIRSGYVVNLFYGVPPEMIQLTRALLLAAMLQAAKTKQAGLIDLDNDAQKLIVQRTDRWLKSKGYSLLAPDFKKLPPVVI